MNTRTISAFRVKTTLKKVGSLNSSAKVHVLARTKGFFSSFFLVGENWEDELENAKSVKVLAEINCSKETGNIQFGFVDPSLTFSHTDLSNLAAFQSSVRSVVL